MRRIDFQPSKYSKLCSEHFTENDFLTQFGLRKLKPDAVPSRFKFPEHLKIKSIKPRSQRLLCEVSSR